MQNITRDKLFAKRFHKRSISQCISLVGYNSCLGTELKTTSVPEVACFLTPLDMGAQHLNLYYVISVYKQKKLLAELKKDFLCHLQRHHLFLFFFYIWGPEEGYRKFWSTRSRRAGNLLFIALDCKVAQGIVLKSGQGGG